MKNIYFKFGAVILIPMLIIACSTNSKKGNYLPDLKVEIPESLQHNTEVVEFINSSTAALNQWSVTLEDLVVECEPFVGKTEADLSTMDKLKLGKIMMEFMSNMGQFAVKASEIQQSATMIADGLSEEEAQALDLVKDSFEQRIEELGKKYENFGKEALNTEES